MKLFAAISLVMVLLTATALAQQAAPSALTRTQIKEAERFLSDLGFWTGPIDGVLDAGTRSALIAFQKWHGRQATDQLTTEELEAIHKSALPRAREFGYEHVEVDLDRQVLMLVNENVNPNDEKVWKRNLQNPRLKVKYVRDMI